MKKSILLTLAVAAAFGTQAALVDWQYMITKQSDSTVPGYMAYLIDAATWDGTGSSPALKDNVTAQSDLSNAALDEASFMLKDSSGKGTSKVYNFSTKTAENLAQARPVDVGSAASIDAYIVLFDATKGYLASDKMTIASRGESDSAGTSGTFSQTAAAVSGATWTAVPEPTTVALFALGLAAVGLKRKVA